MQIWIDNTQLNDVPSLDEALERARLHAEDSGRLIVDILVDGKPATDELFDDPTGSSASINELRFTTADTNTLILETVQTAIESIELLRADQRASVEQIRSGNIEDSMETMRSILEGWHSMRDLVDQIAQIANIEIPSVQVGSVAGSEIINSLSNALSEVRETLQNKDWSSLGDVIEYDLDELATQWSELLSALIQGIPSS